MKKTKWNYKLYKDELVRGTRLACFLKKDRIEI